MGRLVQAETGLLHVLDIYLTLLVLVGRLFQAEVDLTEQHCVSCCGDGLNAV